MIFPTPRSEIEHNSQDDDDDDDVDDEEMESS